LFYFIALLLIISLPNKSISYGIIITIERRILLETNIFFQVIYNDFSSINIIIWALILNTNISSDVKMNMGYAPKTQTQHTFKCNIFLKIVIEDKNIRKRLFFKHW
jgi:hypothetical protein